MTADSGHLFSILNYYYFFSTGDADDDRKNEKVKDSLQQLKKGINEARF